MDSDSLSKPTQKRGRAMKKLRNVRKKKKKENELYITPDIPRSDRYKLFTNEMMKLLFCLQQNINFCAAIQ